MKANTVESAVTEVAPSSYTVIWPEVRATCLSPWTGRKCQATNWAIPGMWVMLEATCPDTGRRFQVEAAYGLGLPFPMAIDPERGDVLAYDGPRWFRHRTERALLDADNEDVEIVVHRRRKARQACLVNCCHPFYGDCVSLLFRIAALKDTALDVIVVIPSALNVFVPEWVAEVWEIPGERLAAIAQGGRWRWGMARALRRLVAEADSCCIPHFFQPPMVTRDAVRDFTGVDPFDRESWTKHPFTVGVLWRDDRLFPQERQLPLRWRYFLQRMGLHSFERWLSDGLDAWSIHRHIAFLRTLERGLRARHRDLRLVVFGHGCKGRIPAPLLDLRCTQLHDQGDLETALLASHCHVMITTHGSHLVPFSSLPGALIQMFPDEKWGNFDDTRVNTAEDWAESAAFYRDLPCSTPVSAMVAVVNSLLENAPVYRLAYDRRYDGPVPNEDIDRIRRRLMGKPSNSSIE